MRNALKKVTLSHVFWIYQDKIIIFCRADFSTSETIKSLLIDKKWCFIRGQVIQSVHFHQYMCDFFPTEEANFNLPKVVAVVFLYTPHMVSFIVNSSHYYHTLQILIFQDFLLLFLAFLCIILIVLKTWSFKSLSPVKGL